MKIAATVKFKAFSRKDAELRVVRIASMLEKLGVYARRKWDIDMTTTMTEPVKGINITLDFPPDH